MLKSIFKLITLIVGIVTIIVVAFNSSTKSNNIQQKNENRKQTERSWSNIDLEFKNNPALIEKWTNLGFNYEQVKDWQSCFGWHFNPREYDFASWIKSKGYDPISLLNHGDLNQLKNEFKQETNANSDDSSSDDYLTNELTQLLNDTYPSNLQRKIVLDENFLTLADQWKEQILDFSYYPDLEIIEVGEKGNIKLLNITNNINLKELNFAQQELTGILDLSKNSKLEKLNLANNNLDGLKVHSDFYPKVRHLDKKCLSPQKHNPHKLDAIKDITWIVSMD